MFVFWDPDSLQNIGSERVKWEINWKRLIWRAVIFLFNFSMVLQLFLLVSKVSYLEFSQSVNVLFWKIIINNKLPISLKYKFDEVLF
jgi:hypothetical protein